MSDKFASDRKSEITKYLSLDGCVENVMESIKIANIDVVDIKYIDNYIVKEGIFNKISSIKYNQSHKIVKSIGDFTPKAVEFIEKNIIGDDLKCYKDIMGRMDQDGVLRPSTAFGRKSHLNLRSNLALPIRSPLQ